MSFLRSFALSDFPLLVESIVPPIALFILASKLNPDKPQKNAIKWGLITGTIYIFVFWLTNTTLWLTTLDVKGTGYLTSYPENLISFILTTFGLLALAIYTTYFTKKSIGAEDFTRTKTENHRCNHIGAWNVFSLELFNMDFLRRQLLVE